MPMPKLRPQRRLKAQFTVTALLASLTAQAVTATHLGTPVMGLTQAQAQVSPRLIQTSQNSKVIPLLLAATREENPQRALKILDEARTELKKEGLASADTARISGLIDDLEKKLRTRIGPQNAPANNSGSSNSGTTAAGVANSGTGSTHLLALPAVTDLASLAGTPATSATTASNGGTKIEVPATNAAEVAKTLQANPEVRDMLWEIGRSRLARDTHNLDGLVQDRTGKTVAEIDTQEEALREAADKPGALLSYLDSIGLLKLDVSKSNLQLKQEYDGISLDVLADHLIGNAMRFSGGAGALRGALIEQGKIGNYGGLAIETAGTLAVNAKLVLRLADLYGIEMDETERQMVLNLVFLAFKVGLRYGIHSPTTQSIFASLGNRFTNARSAVTAGGGLIAFMKSLATNKAVLSAAGPEAGALLANVAKTEAPHSTTAAGTPEKPATRSAKLKAWADKVKLTKLFHIVAQGALSSAETYGVGVTAKELFRSARLERRRIHNENFRRFLMTAPGEGFFKLLVLSMNDGRPSTDANLNNPQSLSKEMRAKTEFIMNTARSARMCSASDLKALEAKTDREMLATLRYACDGNSSVARFNRLQAEILTFGEIPQEYVADLRAVSREHRLRMGELILQMQIIDGDRNPDEVQFFRNVIAKILGLDGITDLEYFDRLQSFIYEHGGLERSKAGPTGFAIRNTSEPAPYDMNIGYTSINGPDAPNGRAAEESSKDATKK